VQGLCPVFTGILAASVLGERNAGAGIEYRP
jgi:hypothetical protein